MKGSEEDCRYSQIVFGIVSTNRFVLGSDSSSDILKVVLLLKKCTFLLVMHSFLHRNIERVNGKRKEKAQSKQKSTFIP